MEPDARDGDRRWPVPAALERSNDPVLGRGAELAVLDAAWERAIAGRACLAVVRGEPGIGKSTLVAAFADRVSGRGGMVLGGACDPHMDVPYQPFAEALRAYLAMVDADRDDLGDLPGELAHLVPELAARIPDLPAPIEAEPTTQRYRLAEAIASWLTAASTTAPLLLVLEDVHWAGKGTGALLRHVLANTTAARLVIAVTTRDAEPGDEVSAEMTEGADITVALRGLDLAALVEWLEHAGRQELDDEGRDFAAGLERDTGGNPLYVREVLRHLVETGWLYREEGRWTGPADSPGATELPGSLREVLVHRLNRLPDDSRRVLGAAAVLGRTFEVSVLREICGPSPEAVAEALDAMEGAGLLSPSGAGRFTFTHALVRAAMVDLLGPTRRATLHRDVAQLLEQRADAQPAELAHHWAEASPLVGPDRAADALVAAGEAAVSQLAFDEAVRHFERALGFVRDRDRHLGISLRLGMLQQRGGDERFRATLDDVATRALAAGDGPTLVQAALASCRPGIWYASVGVVDHALVRRYEQAIDVLGPEPSPDRARLLSLLAQELYWSNERDRRLALAREALQVAREVGDACVDMIIPPYVMATWEPSTRQERLALVDELEARASGTGTLETRFYAHYLRGVCLGEGGDMVATAAELEVASELADELRYPILQWRCLTRDGALASLAGPDGGEGAAMAALEVGQACGQPDALSSFGAQYFLVSWDRGQLAGLEETVIAFVDAMPGIPSWRAVLAMLYVETQQWERAAEQVAIAARADCHLPPDSAWMVGTSLLGECVARLGDRARATLLYDYLLPYQNDVVDVVQGLAYLGSVARVLGLLATTLDRTADADRHFARALDIEQRIGAACFAVRTRRDHAMALAARGTAHHGRAVDLARAALDDADGLGMVADVVRLTALLVRLDALEPQMADDRS